MLFNNLLASPSFESWMEGVALDIQSMLYTKEGKPRVAIFSISHLNDTDADVLRVAVLYQVIGWMRQQPGTTSLRRSFTWTRFFGYFPPVKNPPSKTPMLTLLKQARAFALAWCWPLRTRSTSITKASRIAALGSSADCKPSETRCGCSMGSKGRRHRAGEVRSRRDGADSRRTWGTRVPAAQRQRERTDDIHHALGALLSKRAADARADQDADGPAARQAVGRAVKTEQKTIADDDDHADSRAILPPEVPQFFLPLRSSKPNGAVLVYKPRILGCAQIYYSDKKADVDLTNDLAYLVDVTDDAVAVDWTAADEEELSDADLEKSPADENCLFGHLPRETAKPKAYDGWEEVVRGFSYRNQKITIYKCDELDVTSKPDESEREFRVRSPRPPARSATRNAEALRTKFARSSLRSTRRFARRPDRGEKATGVEAVETDGVLNFGGSILSAFIGKKSITAATIGKATTSVSKAGKSMKDSQDATMADENVESLKSQKEALEKQFK